ENAKAHIHPSLRNAFLYGKTVVCRRIRCRGWRRAWQGHEAAKLQGIDPRPVKQPDRRLRDEPQEMSRFNSVNDHPRRRKRAGPQEYRSDWAIRSHPDSVWDSATAASRLRAPPKQLHAWQ